MLSLRLVHSHVMELSYILIHSCFVLHSFSVILFRCLGLSKTMDHYISMVLFSTHGSFPYLGALQNSDSLAMDEAIVASGSLSVVSTII